MLNMGVSKPEILTHPHIPKPLHGMNPRTILGKEWWDKTRFEAQKRTNYKCSACGVHKSNAKKHQWLEGHEYWNIDYNTGICEVVSIEPLCHYCHNFIHSGRLAMIIGGDKSKSEVIEILEHGFKILSDNKLNAFPFTLKFARKIGARTYGVKSQLLNSYGPLKWTDYVMILEGKKYHGKFKNINEWKEYEPFDHKANFCKKVKENWLSDKDFAALKSASLYGLTQALIDKKMDDEYLEEIMKMIDSKENNYMKYIRKSLYFDLIRQTPLENMQRIYKKYDGIDFLIQRKCRDQLEFYIGEAKRKLRDHG